jgi:hypothetical protein
MADRGVQDLHDTRRAGCAQLGRGPHPSSTALEEVGFAHDSALEGDGFELSVPRVMGGRFRTTGTSGDRGFRGVRPPRWRCSAAPCPSRARENKMAAELRAEAIDAELGAGRAAPEPRGDGRSRHIRIDFNRPAAPEIAPQPGWPRAPMISALRARTYAAHQQRAPLNAMASRR